MKIFLKTALVNLLVWVAGFAFPGEVILDIPAPGGFCTGMTFDGNALWVADYHADSLFLIDVREGKTVRALASPGYWPAGLAWDGRYLWNADRKQAKIFKIDPDNGRVLRVLDAPGSSPAGMAWDGETLWVADDRANRIDKLDLSDGTAIRSIDMAGPQGLTFDGTYFWCSDRSHNEITMIDPVSEQIILAFASPGPYPRGMAWDGFALWVVDYETDRISKIVRQDQELYRLSDTRHATITLMHQAHITGQGSVLSLDVFFAIPENRPQQKVLSISYSPALPEVVSDKWGQKFAAFRRQNLESCSISEAEMRVEADISAIQYFIFPEHCGTLADIPANLVAEYTADGSKYRIFHPFIQETVRQVVGDEQNPYWVARKLYRFVGETLEYKLEGGWNIAPYVLQRGTGSCSEYSFSFISLCRAAGLPARYVGAAVVRGDDASLDEVFHRWPEVYLPNYGWVPMDPQAGDKASPRDQLRGIGRLPNRFLITTQGGGDSGYIGWSYNMSEKYTCEPRVSVVIENFAEWEPRPDNK